MPNNKKSEPLSQINWGIIGCGDVTEIKSGPAFNKVPGSSLIAVMRRDAALAKDYALRHGVPKWYADADQLINDPDVNAIYIATPPKYHEEYALAAMKAGKPVYVEKPMALDTAACNRMLQCSRNTGVKLTIAHYRRAMPMFLQVKDLLKEGVIGDIRTVTITMLQPDQSAIVSKTKDNWRVDPSVAGAGLFFDLAPHQLDLLLYFFGTVSEAAGFASNQAGLYHAEDVVAGTILLKKNILFNGLWCFTIAEGMSRDIFEIHGSVGRISFPVFGHEICVEIGDEKNTLSFEPPQHVQQPMIAQVVQYFLGNAENPCSAADAAASMDIMEKFVYGNRKNACSL